MAALPPDLPRLRILEPFLQLQLDDVREAIHRAERAERQPMPTSGFLIQHIPAPGGSGPGDGVIHVDTCTLLQAVADESKILFEAPAIRIALDDSNGLNACQHCKPHEALPDGC